MSLLSNRLSERRGEVPGKDYGLGFEGEGEYAAEVQVDYKAAVGRLGKVDVYVCVGEEAPDLRGEWYRCLFWRKVHVGLKAPGG